MFLIGPGCRGPEVGHGLRQSICQSTHSNKQFYPPDGRVHVWYLLLRNMHDIFLDFAEEEERSGAIEMHPHRFASWTSLASGVHRARIIASTGPISSTQLQWFVHPTSVQLFSSSRVSQSVGSLPGLNCREAIRPNPRRPCEFRAGSEVTSCVT